jgi:hypothetical protein
MLTHSVGLERMHPQLGYSDMGATVDGKGAHEQGCVFENLDGFGDRP